METLSIKYIRRKTACIFTYQSMALVWPIKLILASNQNDCSGIQLGFFCRKLPCNDTPIWRHFLCSLKNKEMGYCWKLSRVRGSALLAEREGGNKKVSVLENVGEHWSTSSPYFSNCMGNDVTPVRLCLTTFCKKTKLYTTIVFSS